MMLLVVDGSAVVADEPTVPSESVVLATFEATTIGIDRIADAPSAIAPAAQVTTPLVSEHVPGRPDSTTVTPVGGT